MPEHSGHGGGHGPVIPPADQFSELYGELRAQLLSRHFALGRYFRADHLCFYNYLGVVHRTGGTPDNNLNDLVHRCLWSNVLNGNGTNVYPPPNSVYRNAAGLLALPLGTGQPNDQLFERWRVGDHWRVNPLMYSGQLMVCLAVEASLGIPGSLDILSRLLSTTRSLFKSPSAPYTGYILRWDAVTTDHWTVLPEQTIQAGQHQDQNAGLETKPAGMGANPSFEELVPRQLGVCCDFFPITDPSAPDGYLYSTPLDDPRYTAYLETSDFKALSDAQQQSYFAARTLSLYQNRYWEPSQDELTGYLAGLSFVSAAVSDETIKAEAASQAALVGGWMSANGYLLVRPNGGFAAQGAAGVGDSLEFPFGRIFSRLTGSSFAATGGFISALQNSGIWPAISTGWNAATILGIAAGTLLATLGGSFLGAVILAVLGSAAGIVAARAWVLSLDYEAFDVYAWPGNNSIGISSSHGQQTQFSAAYLFSILSSKLRFVTWLAGAGLGIGGYSQNFPPFLGLSAFGDTDTTVRNAYLRWFSQRNGNTPAPGSIPPRPQTTLAAPMTNSQTSITVNGSSGFGKPNFFVSIGSETLLVTGFAGTGGVDWTVARGQLGTISAAAPNNATVTGMPFAQTTLTAPITNSQTFITVNSSSNFGSPTFNVSIGSELLQVTGWSGPGNTTWNVSRGQGNSLPAAAPEGATVTGMAFDDSQGDFPNFIDPFATAVAVLLGAGASTQTKLGTLLNDLTAEFDTSSRQRQLAVFDDNPVLYCSFAKSTTPQLVNEPIRPTLNYLAAVALAWFFSSLPTTDKNTLPQGFPVPPPNGSSLPPATIPGGVVQQSFGIVTSEQVIAHSGLPPYSGPIPDELDLFAPGAPSKPAKPPAPPVQTAWVLSTQMSHSGNWFGSKGTETLNAGQTLPPPGVILGVKLFLIDKHGVPLGGVPTSVALGRASQIAGVPPWPSPRARTGGIFQAGARILSIGSFSNKADMTVTVQWWYAATTACRYQIAYLVETPTPSPAQQNVDLSYMIPLLGS
jgi:hypothetical protein